MLTSPRVCGILLLGFLSPLGGQAALAAQGTGTVQGIVTAESGAPLRAANVSVAGTPAASLTNVSGVFVLSRVPAGQWTLVVQAIGYRESRVEVSVSEGLATRVELILVAQPVILGEVMVVGASRAPEPIVHAPAAVAVVPAALAEALSPTGQVPSVLAGLPGADVVQSGVNDFNVNTRGFNSTLNRRLLVLQDGRDLSIAILGSQEWNTMSVPLEDFAGIELLRGPSSALYGANAYSGVLSLSTPAARDVVGAKLSMAGGNLGTVRGDLRYAATIAEGRAGVRVNLGYARSDSWSRSRTAPGDLAREYADAVDTVAYPVQAPNPGFELLPLAGQTTAGIGMPAAGQADAVRNTYGSARFDWYAAGGAMLTAEGGAALGENDAIVTGIGRVQVIESLRPWGRVAWTSDRLRVFGTWSARQEQQPQRALASGLPIDEQSSVSHLEAQLRSGFYGQRGRLIVGAAVRRHAVDTRQTLLGAADDDRTDWYQSVYGQAEFEVSRLVRLVTAARYDDGDLLAGIVSPKAGVVLTPNEHSSFRFTYNRAFQAPNLLEYFLRVPAGAPANFLGLETALRASPLGPALAGVPVGQLFTNSAAVPVLALGNAELNVERVTSYELGWKGQLGDRLFLTVDAFYSRLRDFVTDLLPGVNPAYGAWTAPPQVPAGARASLEQAVRNSLQGAGQTVAALGLTRLPADSSTAIVVSVANAGRAREQGIEIGAGWRLARMLQLDVNYSHFNFEIDSASLGAGDRVLPNAPSNRFNIALSLEAPRGVEARVGLRLAESYDWAAGAFVGHVPASQLVDANVSWQLSHRVRLHAVATNMFDQRRYQAFGGSLIGRRVIAGLTATM